MTDKTKLEQELARENFEKAPLRAWDILSHIAKEHGWDAIESLIDGKAWVAPDDKGHFEEAIFHHMFWGDGGFLDAGWWTELRNATTKEKTDANG